MTTPLRPRECATYGKVTFQLGVLKEGRTLRASYTVQDYLTPQRLPGEGNGTRTKHQDLCQILTTLTSTHKLLALFLIPLFSTPWKCLKCMGSLGGNQPCRLEMCETSKGQGMEPQGYTFQPGKGHRQGGSRGSRDSQGFLPFRLALPLQFYWKLLSVFLFPLFSLETLEVPAICKGLREKDVPQHVTAGKYRKGRRRKRTPGLNIPFNKQNQRF